jgi:hypothetical protein
MTPTLTNAQKYSPEFGFEPGVVVAVNRKSTPPYFDDGITIYGELDRVRDGILAVGGTLIRTDDIVSIRILSGRWAIWQFAPTSTAVCCIEDSDILFFTAREWEQLKPLDGVVMPAPWWWLEGQK